MNLKKPSELARNNQINKQNKHDMERVNIITSASCVCMCAREGFQCRRRRACMQRGQSLGPARLWCAAECVLRGVAWRGALKCGPTIRRAHGCAPPLAPATVGPLCLRVMIGTLLEATAHWIKGPAAT